MHITSRRELIILLMIIIYIIWIMQDLYLRILYKMKITKKGNGAKNIKKNNTLLTFKDKIIKE